MMARFLAYCCVIVSLQQVVAPPPQIIEAFRPTTAATTTYQDLNSGFGTLKKLNKMLTKLEHQIDDINVRRKIMEEQMKSPFGFMPDRMEAAIDFTYTITPSTVYINKKIISANNVFLQIFDDGTANGTRDDTSPYAKITIEMVGVGQAKIDRNTNKTKSVVKMLIKGAKTNTYLGCKENGRFITSTTPQVFLYYEPDEPRRKNGKPCVRRPCLLWSTRKYVNLECKASRHSWLLGFRNNDKLKKGRHSRGSQLDSWFMIL